MALDIDLSRKPYFDDYEVTKNFYRVLYRPAAAVQARELNQMQTILQDQIDKFGRHIFKDGSVVEGCAFTFDNAYNFVKIKDNYANNSAISNINDFNNRIAVNSRGLRARVVNTLPGFESENPNLNTLYVKYLNSTTYANGSQQSEFSNNEVIQIQTDSAVNIGNVVVATVANSAGKGYAFTTTEGVIFKKGFFIRVEPQTLVVSRYNNVPDGISVGFEANEEIITAEIDTTLLDNAAGSPNYDAPGAHRLKLVPTLVTREITDTSNTSTFFSLCDFKSGLPVSIKNDPQYAALAKDQARRTFETNGDYIVNPFLLSTEKKFSYTSSAANTDYLSIVSSPGIAYVKGYRVEFINNNTADLRKATDYAVLANQIVTANFGHYFNVTELVGDFNNDQIAEIEIHSLAKTAISSRTFLSTSYSSATKIGTAYVRGVEYYEGTPGEDANYSIYVFNVAMLPGQRLSDAKSLILYNGSLKAVADIILEVDTNNTGVAQSISNIARTSNIVTVTTTTTHNYAVGQTVVVNAVTNTSINGTFTIASVPTSTTFTYIQTGTNIPSAADTGTTVVSQRLIAKIQESAGETAIIPFGQKAIRPEGFSSTARFVYRNKADASFLSSSGSLSLTLSSAAGTGTETFNYGTGLLNQTAKNSFIVVPTATGYSNADTGTRGTVSVNTSSPNVVGTSTTFSTQYTVGDYFFCSNGTSGATRRVVSIGNNTAMIVDSLFPFTNTGIAHQKTWPAGVPINLAPSNRTINITSTTTANISLGETSNANFDAAVYFDVLRANTVPIEKTVKKSTLVRIQANTNAGGVTGPWCLGIPDVYKLNAVYVDSTGGTYSNTNPDRVTSFRLDSGQRDSYYGLAYLVSTTPIAPNATLLVSIDNFVAVPSQGVGFFTAASYKIDDANTANSIAIQTWQIPQYVSSIGVPFDLRDSVDFRPYANNTANNIANNVSDATLNPSGTLTLFSYNANGSYIPTPGTNYESTIHYYLPRKDRISLTSGGEILVTEGTAAIKPTPPPEVPGTMTIGIATVAPYPSLTPTEAKQYNRYDYAIQTSILQTKRYTMADINKINTRIDRLEYYTSLSLLEQATTSLLVRSGDTGQNRFKNGILVDPFKNHSIGNTNDPTYMIAIDEVNAEARPYFRQQTIGMRFDSAASTAVQKGYVVMLPHTSAVNQRQRFASKFRNCIEGNIFTYRGTVVLDPPGILDADITQAPAINSTLDLSSNWVNLAGTLNSMFGTQYGNWTNYGAAQVVGTQSSDNIMSTSGGSFAAGQLQNWQTNVTTTLSQQQRRINREFGASAPSETNIDLGNYVTNVAVQQFVPARQIFFSAKGMKPNTRLYVYLEDIALNQDVLPLTPYTGALTSSGGNNFTNTGRLVYISRDQGNFQYGGIADWGNALFSDASGNVYGILAIPAGLFKQGDLVFKITDVADPSVGADTVSTQCSTKLFCSALAVQKTESNLQILNSAINIEEEVQNRTVYRNTLSSETWQWFDTSIRNPHCPPQNFPPNISQISQGFGPPPRR